MSDYKFEPFQPVLVRIGGKWNADFFSHLEDLEDLAGDNVTRYMTASGKSFIDYNILPYDDDTKHLLGTKDEPKPKWQPKPGELVAVSDDKKKWFAQVFISKIRGRKEGAYESSDTHDSSQPTYWQYCEPLNEHFNMPDCQVEL